MKANPLTFLSTMRNLGQHVTNQVLDVGHTITAMRLAAVKRLIVLTTTALTEASDQVTVVQRRMRTGMDVAPKKLNRDHLTATRLMAAREHDWTIVRAVVLTNDLHTGRYWICPLNGTLGRSERKIRLSVITFCYETAILTTHPWMAVALTHHRFAC